MKYPNPSNSRIVHRLHAILFVVSLNMLLMAAPAALEGLGCAEGSWPDIEAQVPLDDFIHDGDLYFDYYHIKAHGSEIADEGASPALLILHELPGLGESTFCLGQALAKEGYDIYIPRLFGSESGQKTPIRNILGLATSKYWDIFSSNGNEGILSRLETFSSWISAQHNNEIGVIGNCLTGAFPVYLMGSVAVKGVVISQPSTPVHLPLTYKLIPSLKSHLGLPLNTLPRIKEESTAPMLGFRFYGDQISPPEKLQVLQNQFGEQFTDCSVSQQELNRESPQEDPWHAVLTSGHRSISGGVRILKVIEFFDRVLKSKKGMAGFKCTEL